MTDIILIYILLGSVFFAFCVIVMVFLFGWAGKDAGKNILGLILLLSASISLPFAVTTISSGTFSLDSKASEIPKIFHIEITPINNGEVLVNISLEKPATAYLKYLDSKSTFPVPILPTSSFSLRMQHSFIINPTSPQGGTAVLVINDHDYLYKGQTLEIKPK